MSSSYLRDEDDREEVRCWFVGIGGLIEVFALREMTMQCFMTVEMEMATVGRNS